MRHLFIYARGFRKLGVVRGFYEDVLQILQRDH